MVVTLVMSVRVRWLALKIVRKMKNVTINSKSLLIQAYMFLSGRDKYDLPETTCGLIRGIILVFSLAPISFGGQLVFRNDKYEGIWNRTFIGALLWFVYSLFVILGMTTYSGLFDVGIKPDGGVILGAVFEAMSWWEVFLLYPTLLIAGTAAFAAACIGMGYLIAKVVGFFIHRTEDAFERAIDEYNPNDAPEGFKEIMVAHYNKTCAKIDWK